MDVCGEACSYVLPGYDVKESDSLHSVHLNSYRGLTAVLFDISYVAMMAFHCFRRSVAVPFLDGRVGQKFLEVSLQGLR